LEFDYGISAAIADIALLEAGIAGVPVPSFFNARQRDHVLLSSGACVLLSDLNPDCPDGNGAFRVTSLDNRLRPVLAGTAKISFTSGSTGTPKGICLSATHLLQVAQSVVDYVGDAHAGRHLALLPPGILLENVAGFYAVMLAGGTYVALPQAEIGFADPFRPDIAKLLRVIGEQRISSLILVPEYLGGLVTAMEMSGWRFPALSLVAVGGARLSPDLIARAEGVGLPVRQGYGLTECASVVTLEDADEAVRGSVGRSLGRNTLSVADDGEILIHGPVCLGSIGAPATAGPYRSGDIGRVDSDGRIWIEGRKSNLIITSHGRNISPEWVEGALLAKPAIAQAMVYGDGEAALGALIVPASDNADIDAAIKSANAELPAYARIADFRIVPPFTPANGMLTGNGRIKRDIITKAHLTGDTNMAFFDRLVAETADAQALLGSVPQLQAGLAGRIDRDTYIAYLTQAYHHVRHTVPLLSAARAKLADKPAYAGALAEYIEEETGHEKWILSDIAAAGGDAAKAEASEPATATAAMVNHAYDVIENGNAVGFFGMVYVLEGTSIAMATNGAAAVQKALGLPKNAFSYLTSHGALDQEHMKFFAGLMNSIGDEADQQAIISMARDMFRLFADMFVAIPMEHLDEAA
jgi:pyrroloquinoline quinone (PQQ) biosynthesis protein C